MMGKEICNWTEGKAEKENIKNVKKAKTAD